MQMYYQNKRTIWAEIKSKSYNRQSTIIQRITKMLLLLISKSFLDFLRQKKASKGG